MRIFNVRNGRKTNDGYQFILNNNEIFMPFCDNFPVPAQGWEIICDIFFEDNFHILCLSDQSERGYWVVDENFFLVYSDLQSFIESEMFARLMRTRFNDLVSDGPVMVAIIDVVNLIVGLAETLASTGKKLRIETDLANRPEEAAFLNSLVPPEIKEFLVNSERNLAIGHLRGNHSHFGALIIDRFLPFTNFWYAGFSSDDSIPLVCFISDHPKIPVAVLDTDSFVYYGRNPIERGVRSAEIIAIGLIYRFLYSKLRKLDLPERGIGIALRENHIGHYMWNELSCVEAILRQGKTPELFSYASSDEPMFAVDDIYPEVKGHIERGNLTLQRAIEVWATGVHFFPFMAYQIRQSLADRILTFSHNLESELAGRLAKLRETHTLVLIGVRVENRMWANQAAGYSALLRRLDSIGNRKFHIIFDGHNISNDKKSFYKSFAEVNPDESSDSPILQRELEIVWAVEEQAKADNLKYISIENLIPCTGSASIVASNMSHYFVTHWGAGLAKYKWAANAQGMVFSSSYILNTKGDLRIYDIETFKENAKSLDFFPSDKIVDLSVDNGIIAIQDSERKDFDIDPDVFAEVVAEKILAIVD